MEHINYGGYYQCALFSRQAKENILSLINNTHELISVGSNEELIN